jgi:hypothetical protein
MIIINEMSNKEDHIELGFIDIPKAYSTFTPTQKKAVCNQLIDLLLTDIDKNLEPHINRISFLDEVLESSLQSNEQDEEYIVCQVLFDCRKYLKID